jgi:GxxExxY protein
LSRCILVLTANRRKEKGEPDRSKELRRVYKGHDLKTEFCPDLIVDGIVVVELKAIEQLAPVHKAQLITYLKLTGLPVGLLINFNVPLLKQGIQRSSARIC